jgi:putative redox protein
MSQVQVTWVKNEQFVGTDSTNHSIVLSTGKDGTGSKPSDLLLIALGACTAVDVVSILAKKRQKLTGLEIKVNSQQDADPPWTFRQIHVEYVVRGKGISEKAVQHAIEISEQKYCSVAATIRGVAEITSGFQVVEDSSDERTHSRE